MNLVEKWRAHIEAHKFTGPTVKVLKLEDDLFAVLDHEYNLVDLCHYISLAEEIVNVKHPPQRERPRPILPADEPKLSQVNLIEVGDLDL